MQETGTQYTLLNMFYDGGVFMYPLVLCSLFALGVIIAKGYTLLVAQRKSQSILNEVEELIKQGRIDAAVERAEETPGPVAAIGGGLFAQIAFASVLVVFCLAIPDRRASFLALAGGIVGFDILALALLAAGIREHEAGFALLVPAGAVGAREWAGIWR